MNELHAKLALLRAQGQGGAPVLLAEDEEGNAFHEVAEVERGFVRRDGSAWEVIHPEDADEGEDEGVVIWP